MACMYTLAGAHTHTHVHKREASLETEQKTPNKNMGAEERRTNCGSKGHLLGHLGGSVGRAMDS